MVSLRFKIPKKRHDMTTALSAAVPWFFYKQGRQKEKALPLKQIVPF